VINQLREQMPEVSVRLLYRRLNVNRRWYYQRQKLADRKQREANVCQAMEEIIMSFPRYGYRRMTHALVRAGWQVGHMRQRSWLCRNKRRTVHTMDSRHRYRWYPNLVAQRQFDAPDQCWMADLTHIRLPKAFVYLACPFDVYSRKCLGWSLGRGLDSTLTLQALEMALKSREVCPGLIHHSDQGVQYANTAYVHRLCEIGAHISMAAVGTPYQNAFAEGFMKTLKTEEVYLNDYQTLEDARAQH
jgi:putative transposase